MGNTKRRKVSPFEIIIGASAVLVSLCALFVSISQVKIMREQMHLAVMPRIDISFSENSSEDLNISITNSGIGPAEILTAKVEYDSVAVASWEELFKIMNKDSLKLESYTASKLKDRMLVPMQIFPILTIKGKNYYKLLDANKEKIKITICYKSLYDDYFEVCRTNLGVSSAITNKSIDRVSISEKESFQR
jgi:hypothetical protein